MAAAVRPDPRLLLPRHAEEYRGARWALVVLVVYAVVATGRSLVHVLAPDSGPESIATLDVEGGRNAVALLGQWGGAQLLMALLVWVALVVCGAALLASLTPRSAGRGSAGRTERR